MINEYHYQDVSERWVDKIPSHWEMLRLKRILQIRKEKNNPVVTDFILSLTASQGVVPVAEKEGAGGNKPKDDLTKYGVARKNDLLVNCMNVVAGSAGVKMNFALIVPTKALINEIYKQVIDEDLKNLLSERNYKVVTAAGDALARDITNEVHGDYYLAQIIKKGVAYHIGYLPAAIRMRIEDMFRRGKITTIFCTSTLLEGVNLPADNLFITDNKIFRKVMTPVDFRNLIGRVGRIRFNLYGNVFFVSQGEKLKQEDYVDLLKKEVPKQTLSIEAGPKSLTNAEKKYVVEALLQGNIELVKRNDAQSEEAYVMMRKFALILLRDIMQDNDSLVRREFSNLLTPKDEAKIREAFTDPFTEPDDDINTSVDQTKNLRAAIAMGLKYPDRVDGRFNYDDVLAFLEKLSRIFKWGKYEASTLGKPTLLRWYAVVLIQWMEGTGLFIRCSRCGKVTGIHKEDFESYGICVPPRRNQLVAEPVQPLNDKPPFLPVQFHIVFLLHALFLLWLLQPL